MNELKIDVGMWVPDVSLTDQDGNAVSLRDFSGQKVILFFYPQDDTPTCTTEACNLRDNHLLWVEKGYQVIGVSRDTEKSHRKFIAKYNLPYPLLSDPDRKLIDAFGLWGEKLLFGNLVMGTYRTTFVINEEGMITHVVREVKSKDHTSQLLEMLGLEQ
ncbi:MAG: thioredoxin-dependent thiol peroxidase [Bacteroidia bacterium]